MKPYRTITKGFYWHVHHNILFEWCFDYQERVDFIKEHKPKEEIELRLKLFQPAKDLPEELKDAWYKYDKSRQKYFEAQHKCAEARTKYKEMGQKYDDAKNCVKARHRYDKAIQKDFEVEQNYKEAGQKYNKVMKALHKKECPNCPWNGKTIFVKGGGE